MSATFLHESNLGEKGEIFLITRTELRRNDNIYGNPSLYRLGHVVFGLAAVMFGLRVEVGRRIDLLSTIYTPFSGQTGRQGQV